MTNRVETRSSSRLLENKARIILNDLNKDFSSLQLEDKESVLLTFNQVMERFNSTLASPLFHYRELKRGKTPDISELNESFRAAEQDLKVIYSELGSIREMIAGNFNSLSGNIARVKTGLARSFSELEDYRLQNGRIMPAVMDTFKNSSKIESDDREYSKEKSFIDVYSNNLVLPLKGEEDVYKIKRIQIGDKSNGTSGNNQELGVPARDNLELLADKNLDTWFEYERVLVKEVTTPLVFELKVELDKEEILNSIELATVAFPTGANARISEIKGSNDGSYYFDLLPHYLGKTEKDSRGQEVIKLGSTPENPVDKNKLYFFPKKVKYVVVTFIEDAPYFIKTTTGTKPRLSIGVREISFRGQKFKEEGQFLSHEFELTKEIKKLTLFSDERLPEGPDYTFDYFISTDNGKNWLDIQPSEKVGDKPEVLTFNTDFLDSSIKTDSPVTKIKFKLDMKREKPEGSALKNSTVVSKDKTQFISLPTGQKNLELEETPVSEVDIYKVGLGSIGKDSFYTVPSGNVKEKEDAIYVYLPSDPFGKGLIELDSEIICSDDIVWTRVDSLDGQTSADAVYEFDYLNNIIKFALDDNGVQRGRRPTEPIMIKFKKEAALLAKTEEGAILETTFSHDGIKDSISVYRYEPENSQKTFSLRNRATVHRVKQKDIVSLVVQEDVAGILSVEKEFLDGRTELNTFGDYSVDKEKGIIYTYSTVADTNKVTVSIEHKNRVEVPFEIKNGEIHLSSESYITRRIDVLDTINTPVYAYDFGYNNIEKGSIILTSVPSGMENEIPYSEEGDAFENTTLKNPYTIDYRNGVLYSKEGISGEIKGVFSATDYFIEYELASKVPRTSYTIQRTEQLVQFTDQYVVKYFSDHNSGVQNLFKVSYTFAEEVKESPDEVLEYITPVLEEYRIITG